MNANTYLLSIVKKYSILEEERSRILSSLRVSLFREIRKWNNQYIIGIIPSGSFSKGTAIKGGDVDIDLLISLKNQTPFTLHSYYPRKQNVSIRIVFNGIKVDLVPAKRQPNVLYPHSIYVCKLDTWTKTNIHKHINTIKKSPHKNIIILLKIWCHLHEYYAKIYDLANTNNIVSDTITDNQKMQIIQMARLSYSTDCWEKIVWGLYEIRK